jgi:hypothetical protein
MEVVQKLKFLNNILQKQVSDARLAYQLLGGKDE